jgi:hypothetical protein
MGLRAGVFSGILGCLVIACIILWAFSTRSIRVPSAAAPGNLAVVPVAPNVPNPPRRASLGPTEQPTTPAPVGVPRGPAGQAPLIESPQITLRAKGPPPAPGPGVPPGVGAPGPGAGTATRPEYFFPWPPPRASCVTTFTTSLSDKPYGFSTIGDVADYIATALKKGGIDQLSYFSLPDDPFGYGMATRVEQIDPKTAKPLAGKARWEERVHLAGGISFFDLIVLTERPKGRYRSFVFIMSAKPTPDNPDESVIASLPLARRWSGRGDRFLSPEMRQIRVTPAHHLSVRVYEFEHEDKGQPRFVESSSWTASQHLAADGIQLEKAP